MSFWRWYLRRGRIDRRTYWLHYFLPLALVGIAVDVVDLVSHAGQVQTTAAPGSVGFSATVSWWVWLVSLLLLVPSFSAQVTRLHDRGHPAWWMLWGLLPLAGGIVLLVQMCLAGEPGANRYGPPPGPANPVPDPPYPAHQL